MALALGATVVPVRKPGKRPFETLSLNYSPEYATDCLEMHVDAVMHGQPVMVVDDVLATGGTAAACSQLLDRCQAEVVGCTFCNELLDYTTHSLAQVCHLHYKDHKKHTPASLSAGEWHYKQVN